MAKASQKMMLRSEITKDRRKRGKERDGSELTEEDERKRSKVNKTKNMRGKWKREEEQGARGEERATSGDDGKVEGRVEGKVKKYLMMFLVRMRGAATAAPIKLVPVRAIPLKTHIRKEKAEADGGQETVVK